MEKLLKIFAIICLLCDLVITSQISEVVILGRNASFFCNSSDSKWVIEEKGNITRTIYSTDVSAVPPVLRERGFVLLPTVNKLIVFGSVENNQTVISCWFLDTMNSELISSYIMTVVGPPDSPVNVTGTVLKFSPLLFMLDWQEPFSHHSYPVTNYTVYIMNQTWTDTTYTTLLATDAPPVLMTEDFDVCSASIEVTAANDIGESKPSHAASIVKVPDGQNISIDGAITQDELSTLELQIHFPQLCVGQLMIYTITLREEGSGDIVYRNTTTTVYSEDNMVQYNATITSLEDGVYTVIAYLETGGLRVSSPLIHMLYQGTEETESGRDKEESEASTDTLLVVIAALAAVVVILVMGAIVIAVVYARSRLSLGSHRRVVKENANPIYEGPLYENMEERQQMSVPPPPSSAERRARVGIDNIYHSDPVGIPSSSVAEGLYSELAWKRRQSQTSGVGEREGGAEEEEEEAYTVMSPATPATNGVSFTPYREDRAEWIPKRD